MNRQCNTKACDCIQRDNGWRRAGSNISIAKQDCLVSEELEERHHDCEAELPRKYGTAGVAQPKVTAGKGRYSPVGRERHRQEEESLLMTRETVYLVSTSVQGMTST